MTQALNNITLHNQIEKKGERGGVLTKNKCKGNERSLLNLEICYCSIFVSGLKTHTFKSIS